MRKSGIAVAVGLAVCGVAHAAGDWQEIKDQDGIKVWQRKVPGASIIEFRGETVINAPILHLTTVAFVPGRGTEWQHDCIEDVLLEAPAIDHIFVYNRIKGPLMVSDRDFVSESRLVFERNKRIVHFGFELTDAVKKDPPKGVVRLAALRGFLELRQIDADHTHATYQLYTDPGGSLPTWVVNLVSQDMPFDSLSGLRQQVKKSGYEMDIKRLRQGLDWSGFDLGES